MGFKWVTGSPMEVFPVGFDGYTRELHNAIFALAHSFAPRIESWMKANGSWQDRTTNLRQSLFADVEELAFGASIFFDYGLDYGAFIAFANAGKYDIIGPALDFWSIEVWKAVKVLMSS